MITPATILGKYFGYATFRPLQEEAITDSWKGKDTFVLMPTGGGKSVCYQIPALLREGTAVVISPLISLMKDQVDGLKRMGISAGALNSSLSMNDQHNLLNQIKTKKIKLLYVAPERLMMDSFFSILKTIPVSLFAIDEAHCISEWGHDFRPEYRQLSKLKQQFPNTPLMALTATATPRVRDDIIHQLALSSANTYQASFDRPNLTYHVKDKQKITNQIVTYCKQHPNQSGIIYAMSRKTVEELTEILKENNLSVLPYHAGLSDETRNQNQEEFLRDNVQVMVATVAFGMGIDKPNVRFVIHHDLPPNLERYYQETGRAGRDGLPSECILFFSRQDAVKAEFFLKEKSEEEKVIARKQLKEMISYAEKNACRRVTLLNYFGETYTKTNCASCDRCLTPQEQIDGTIIAQKILSCIFRVGQRFGLNHVTDVLKGSSSEQIKRLSHTKLSTYGILKEFSKKDIKSFISELEHLGYIIQSEGEYPTLSLSPNSKTVLNGQTHIQLTKRLPETERPTEFSKTSIYDDSIFSALRTLRKRLADEEHVPPYIIFSDESLKEMARHQPTTITAFAHIKGVGEFKLQKYGQLFIDEIIANQPSTANHQRPTSLSPTIERTVALFESGLFPEAIAKRRLMTVGTVINHLVTAVEHGHPLDLSVLVSDDHRKVIEEAFKLHGSEKLAPVKAALPEDYTYEELHIVRVLAHT